MFGGMLCFTALKCRAILNCPFGTSCLMRRYANTHFSRMKYAQAAAQVKSAGGMMRG